MTGVVLRQRCCAWLYDELHFYPFNDSFDKQDSCRIHNSTCRCTMELITPNDHMRCAWEARSLIRLFIIRLYSVHAWMFHDANQLVASVPWCMQVAIAMVSGQPPELALYSSTAIERFLLLTPLLCIRLESKVLKYLCLWRTDWLIYPYIYTLALALWSKFENLSSIRVELLTSGIVKQIPNRLSTVQLHYKIIDGSTLSV